MFTKLASVKQFKNRDRQKIHNPPTQNKTEEVGSVCLGLTDKCCHSKSSLLLVTHANVLGSQSLITVKI